MKIQEGNRQWSVLLRTCCEPADFLRLCKGLQHGRQKKSRIHRYDPSQHENYFKNQLCSYAFLHFAFAFSRLFKHTKLKYHAPFCGTYPAVPSCYSWQLGTCRKFPQLKKRDWAPFIYICRSHLTRSGSFQTSVHKPKGRPWPHWKVSLTI